MSHIQYHGHGYAQQPQIVKNANGEEMLVNDFKKMQVEMRAMISGNKSPDKVPLKLK